MTFSNTQVKTAQFWDKKTLNPAPERSRWWHSPEIIRHINKRVCGEDIAGFNQGALSLLNKMTRGRTLKKALSIGCGDATKELALIKQGIVETFDLYELSEERIKLAEKHAERAGLTDKINIFCEEYAAVSRQQSYNFIYWDNSLHHMTDCDEAITKTYDALDREGVFFMNDFVGKSRFQWSTEELDMINAFRLSLPDEFFVLPDGSRQDKQVHRPDSKKMIALDPSEAADSGSILPALAARLDNPRIILTGGCIYHSGLNDILVNIDENSPVLSLALFIDSLLSEQGLNQYAVCIARK